MPLYIQEDSKLFEDLETVWSVLHSQESLHTNLLVRLDVIYQCLHIAPKCFISAEILDFFFRRKIKKISENFSHCNSFY